MFKKQLSIVELNQVCISLDNYNDRPKAVYSGLGRQVYPVVREQIETSQETDVRWYEEALYEEQSIISMLQMYFDKSNTTIKVSWLTLYALQVNVKTSLKVCSIL